MSRAQPIVPVLVLSAAACWAVACGDGTTEPPPPTPPPPDPPRATTVAVTPAEAELTALGETARFSAQVLDQNGREMTGAAVAWSSGDAAIATVDASGLVTAAGNGTATITATSGAATGSATATVMQSAASVVVTPAAHTVTLGDTLRLAAEAFDANGHAIADAEFEWTSSDASVATVDAAGLVTAVGVGASTVTARAGEASGEALVTALEPVAAVVVTPAADTVALGDTLRLAAEAFDDDGQSIADAEFKWSSSDVSVATVDDAGLVRGHAEGTTTVTATSGGTRGTSEVTVENPDRAALVAFYNATDGPNWVNNANWLTDAPLEEWYGVETKDNGRVGTLSLRSNYLKGTFPPELGDLSALEHLNLGFNRYLAGLLPDEFFNLRLLREIELGGTGLGGPLRPEFGNFVELRQLDLQHAGLAGPVPAELGNLKRLWSLILSWNDLSGPIPPELGDLPELFYLSLRGNDLTGGIPAELGELTNLYYLNLHDNELTGRIPAELGQLRNLWGLRLSDNDFTGPVPASLGQLTGLDYLWLHSNDLSGSLPATLGGLTELRDLRAGNNPRLGGPLPASLAALERIETFMAGGTELCAPNDPGLLAWLDGIPFQRVARCDGGAAAYLVQAVQSREFPVPLVAGRPALLRVFVSSPSAAGETMPAVRAAFFRDGAEVHVAEIPASSAPIPAAVDESELDRSANAEIPGEFVEPGLEVVVEIDPDGVVPAHVGLERRIPATGRLALDVRSMPDFRLTLVPFLYQSNPDSSILEITAGMAADPEGHEMLADTRALLPIGGFDVRLHDPVVSSSGSGFTLLRETEAMRLMEGEPGYWLGMIAPVPVSGLLGVAEGIPSWSSFSVPLPRTVAHELGHNMGLWHAPCGGAGGPDPLYPDPDGRIGSWGWNRERGALVSPYASDLMSYCRGGWIGDYHFSNALGHRQRAETPGAGAARTRSVLVWGGQDAEGIPFLEPAFVIDAEPSLPPPGTEFHLAGRTAGGSEVFSFSFDMPAIPDVDDGRSFFVFSIPITWAGALATISLAGVEESVELGPDSDSPMTILRDPATGQVRAILRQPLLAAMGTGGEPGLEVLFSRGVPDEASWR